MDNDTTKVFLDRLSTLQDSLDRIDSDLAQDRKDIQNFQIRLGSVETQMDAIRDQLHDLPQKVNDEVSDATKPIVNETHDLKRVLRAKQFIAFDRPSAIAKLIKKLKRR